MPTDTTRPASFRTLGSCRIGRGCDASVDTELRVKGREALRVIDASVLPGMVSGST